MPPIFQSRLGLSALAAFLACAVAIPVLAAAQGGGKGAAKGRRSGIKLIPGPRGPRGFRGLTGPRGLEGLPGLAGTNGAGGKDGAAGATGTQGVAGPTGAVGATGAAGQTGAAGLTGPHGETGATGPAPTTLWAVVDETGNLVRHGTGTVSAAQLATGEYEVKFEHPVNNCAYTATIGSASDGEAPAGEIAVSIREVLKTEEPERVAVHTYTPTGETTERPFHLVVSCRAPARLVAHARGGHAAPPPTLGGCSLPGGVTRAEAHVHMNGTLRSSERRGRDRP